MRARQAGKVVGNYWGGCTYRVNTLEKAFKRVGFPGVMTEEEFTEMCESLAGAMDEMCAALKELAGGAAKAAGSFGSVGE